MAKTLHVNGVSLLLFGSVTWLLLDFRLDRRRDDQIGAPIHIVPMHLAHTDQQLAIPRQCKLQKALFVLFSCTSPCLDTRLLCIIPLAVSNPLGFKLKNDSCYQLCWSSAQKTKQTPVHHSQICLELGKNWKADFFFLVVTGSTSWHAWQGFLLFRLGWITSWIVWILFLCLYVLLAIFFYFQPRKLTTLC